MSDTTTVLPTDERNQRIVNEYLNDGTSTLESIGKMYGLTRERVRQIVAKGTPGVEGIAQKRREDALTHYVAKAEKAVSSKPFIKTLKSLSEHVGVSVAYLNENRERFSGPVEIVEKRRREHLLTMPRNSERSFSDEDIYEAVRYVHKKNGGKPVTTDMYRVSHRSSDPSASLIELRMGGIINACKGAGVPHNKPRQRRSLTKEEVTGAMIQCARDLGIDSVRLLSYMEYSEWAAKGNGPSGSRVRQIFGNWNNAKMAVNAFS